MQKSSLSFGRSVLFGTTLFVIHLFLILMICPEKTWSAAWLNLATHWDSEWYEAIAQWGYINTDFPYHSGLRTANVVFFPGYPYLARLLIMGLGLPAKVALLLVSNLATLLFWCLFFYILRQVSWKTQWSAGLLVALFPTSWFMFMGYSESLFLFTCCLMLWSASQKRWRAASLAGLFMTATRLIGISVLVAPFFACSIACFAQLKGQIQKKQWDLLQQTYNPLALIAVCGLLGCVGFLLYCQIAFDNWHVYFDMERLFWKGTADPYFLFKLPTWLPPPWGYPVSYAPPLTNGYAPIFIFNFFKVAAFTLSEALVPIFMWLFLLFIFRILRPHCKVNQTSLMWFFAAFFLFLLTCFSLSTRFYESMSRCLLPAWVLLVISDAIHPDGIVFFKSRAIRWNVILLWIYWVVAGGFWLQLLNRYYLGWWVA